MMLLIKNALSVGESLCALMRKDITLTEIICIPTSAIQTFVAEFGEVPFASNNNEGNVIANAPMAKEIKDTVVKNVFLVIKFKSDMKTKFMNKN
jgi:hypothetical protein